MAVIFHVIEHIWRRRPKPNLFSELLLYQDEKLPVFWRLIGVFNFGQAEILDFRS